MLAQYYIVSHTVLCLLLELGPLDPRRRPHESLATGVDGVVRVGPLKIERSDEAGFAASERDCIAHYIGSSLAETKQT
jgi:hypothetical protein